MKKNNLNFQIWKYFTLFSILILVFLWIFQIAFLDSYYKKTKKSEIEGMALVIKNNSDNDELENIIDNLAFKKGICVEIVDSTGSLLFSTDVLNRGCMVGKSTQFYKNLFLNSDIDNKIYEIVNPRFKNQAIMYASKLDNGEYVFLNTSLEPIDSTVVILKNQFIYVTIIVLLLAFGIAYVISNRISKPIVKITEAAKELENGKFDVSFCPNENISEINDLAECLNHTKEELKKTDELRRDLMANVSHDLKTPLTMIKAYAEMTSDLNYDKPDKIKNDMNVIVDEVDRLTILVNDILELSKMQSSVYQKQISEFDLVKLINDIIKRYEIFSETEKFEFIFLHKKKELMIKADKKMIEQVIYNLINNAINYTGDDKLVTIKLSNIDGNCLIEIIDTGKGIDDSDIKYIWDKYYKNKKEHKRHLVGTGLGLTIVKNIFELHNFEYGVKSEKNVGSTFYFIIKKEDII